MVKQGDIHEINIRDERFRVLVVSSDAHNEVRMPWVAPIRRGSVDAPPYLVALHDTDPLGGVIDMDRLARRAPVGAPIGTITGGTMSRVRDAIATVFGD